MVATKEPITIQVEPESELARLVAQAETEPVVLEKDGVRYRIMRDPDAFWAGYDPEAVRAAFAGIRGLLSRDEAEALKAELREQRGQDSEGRPA